MSDKSLIEVTTKYAACVSDLTAAWEFVMGYLDRVGPHPRISISPISVAYDDDTEWNYQFEVVVSGMVRHEQLSRTGGES